MPECGSTRGCGGTSETKKPSVTKVEVDRIREGRRLGEPRMPRPRMVEVDGYGTEVAALSHDAPFVRSRSLFPLPGLGVGAGPATCVGRRAGRRVAVRRRVNECVGALNALYASRAGRPLARVVTYSNFVSESQSGALSRIRSLVWSLGAPPAEKRYGGYALDELLKGADLYSHGAPSTCRPFVASKVKALRDGVNPKPLLDVLPPEAKRLAAAPEKYVFKTEEELRTTPVDEFVTPYFDPYLKTPAGFDELLRLLLPH
eukprot:6470385-Amphidinium_carterae.1